MLCTENQTVHIIVNQMIMALYYFDNLSFCADINIHKLYFKIVRGAEFFTKYTIGRCLVNSFLNTANVTVVLRS